MVSFLAAGMVMSLAACSNSTGSNKTSSRPVQNSEESEITKDTNRTEETEHTGMFYNAEVGEVMIVREDGTVTAIFASQENCVDGTYEKEGEQYHFVSDNANISDEYGTFDGSSWIINDLEYRSTHETGSYSSESTGDGLQINSDGTFVAYKDFENKSGKVIGTYDREGYQWIFTSPGLEGGSKTGTFDGHCWYFEGKEYSYDTDAISFNGGIVIFNHGIFISGEETKLLGARVESLEEFAFGTPVDYKNMTLAPGAFMEMDVAYGDASAKIQAINPYENEAPLAECVICSFYTEDTSGVFQLDRDGNTCGVNNHDDLLEFGVYEYTNEKLVYKTYMLLPFDFAISANDPKGKKVIDLSGDVDLTLMYDKMTLKSFRYDLSDAVCNGLNDNVDADLLAEMDAPTLEVITEVRDSILEDLKAAFAEVDIDLKINETTGEIVMDNNVLFVTDSYELSDSGKTYMDQFMSVYASVLMSDKCIDSVTEVRFEGHTDSQGDFGYNQNLSQKRADAVLNYCLNSSDNGLSEEQKNQLKELATAKGYSCTDLIYDEDGREDRDASRRAAVKFFIDMK